MLAAERGAAANTLAAYRRDLVSAEALGGPLTGVDRDDLAAALQARGVSTDELRARVNALTDAEAAQLTAQIDAAPAGGDVLGLLFTIFVILLVTDILGFTKVFPFTRSLR